MNTPPNSKGNNEMLTQACEAAYEQYKVQMQARLSDYKNNPDAQNFFNEMDAFLDPLFSKLCEDMKAASTIAEQKDLLLKMTRSSFNEAMMVFGDTRMVFLTNMFLQDMFDVYENQLDKQQGANAAKFSKDANPGGAFNAIIDYVECLKIVMNSVRTSPAQELRLKHNIPAGPVTDEQRSMLLKESEAILRRLGEPLIDADKPFQPDMLAPAVMLMMDPQHMREMIQRRGVPTNENTLPSATVEKWNRLQRDYPDMATNVGTLVNAAIAAQGRGRSSLN